MRALVFILVLLLDIIPGGEAFLRPLQKRDSVLVADQLAYGFRLEGVQEGTGLALSDFAPLSGDTLVLVRNWQLDTLKTSKRHHTYDIEGSVIIAPFEPGTYHLPDIGVLRVTPSASDTLVFTAPELEVKTLPVDPETFEIHDIKDQIRYPLTWGEALRILLCLLLAAGVVFGIVLLVRRRRARSQGEAVRRDPPHIVALRKLDAYRSEKFWEPSRQKQFYSGVTDALKEYIDARYGIDAPEMTTAELFAALREGRELGEDQRRALQELFERADFVKFAKYIAPDTDNATVLPTAVKFVTDTYQTELEEEAA